MSEEMGLSNLDTKFRPVDGWPGKETPPAQRRESLFKATYTKTTDLLSHELARLSAKNLVIQLYLQESEIRTTDNMPKKGARPSKPGVIVSFDSRHGPLRYFTDVFTHWEANLRAVALGLEALRKVDRYGISKRGEQYKGYRQLEGPEEMNYEKAVRVLSRFSDVDFSFKEGSEEWVKRAYRKSVKVLHPDVEGGTEAAMRELNEAYAYMQMRDVFGKEEK